MLLRYTTSFKSSCSVAGVIERVSDVIEGDSYNISISEMDNLGITKILLDAEQEGIIFYNSFLPMIVIKIKNEGSGVDISMDFTLKKGVKIIASIVIGMMLLFEVALIYLWIVQNLASSLFLLVPSGLLFLTVAMLAIGLKVCSNRTLEILHTAIVRNKGEHILPRVKLKRCD